MKIRINGLTILLNLSLYALCAILMMNNAAPPFASTRYLHDNTAAPGDSAASSDVQVCTNRTENHNDPGAMGAHAPVGVQEAAAMSQYLIFGSIGWFQYVFLLTLFFSFGIGNNLIFLWMLCG
mmetsp:Transcript_3426/g.13034  ORF Transcript_3426/g.13034 Transcript_3426/m.13034 type:complete len:123 (-) Transcript_3426:1954-2322(-)